MPGRERYRYGKYDPEESGKLTHTRPDLTTPPGKFRAKTMDDIRLPPGDTHSAIEGMPPRNQDATSAYTHGITFTGTLSLGSVNQTDVPY